MKIMTSITDQYVQSFSQFSEQFITWGKSIFFSLLVINLSWQAVVYASKGQTLSECMGDFVRRFFTIFFFYTLMIYPKIPLALLETVLFIGKTLTKLPVDPSSIISQGIGLANRLIVPVLKSSLLTPGFSLIILAIVYLCVIFVFISIALRLAYLLITTTALISVSSIFLSFAALDAARQIARQALDTILANCIKILGIYLVVAGSTVAIQKMVSMIPLKVVALDPYFWILAGVWLFWLLAMGFPAQLARIVTGSFYEARGTNAFAVGVTAISYARNASSAASGILKGVGSVAASPYHFAKGAYQWGSKIFSTKSNISSSDSSHSSAQDSASNNAENISKPKRPGTSKSSDTQTHSKPNRKDSL